MPFEFLQTKLMQKFKKNTHLFLLCRSLILNLMYLCKLELSSSKIVICSSLLCPLSNATTLIPIGFSKKALCTISRSDLIVDWFSTTNLYEVPRVTVSTFDSKKYIQENYSPSSFCTFLRNFNPMLRKKVMTIFPRSPVWNVIQESPKRPTSSDHISDNIARKALKFGPEIQRDFFSNGCFLRILKRHRKKVIAKMPR